MDSVTPKSPSRQLLPRKSKTPTKVTQVKTISPQKTNEISKKPGSKSDGNRKELAPDLIVNFPEIHANFEITKKIGEGTFSKVYLARLRQNKSNMFALKYLVPTSSPGRIENELKCLQILGGKHNVLSVKTVARKHDHIVFVLPYFAHQRFSEVVRDLDVFEIKEYIRNLLVALRHVHDKNIIHRDVKPSNFLFCKQKKLYSLIDFGLAMPVPGCKNSFLKDYTSLKGRSQNTSDKIHDACRHPPSYVCTICKSRRRQSAPRAGTPGFRSPEVLMRHPHQTTAVDMWSAGVILLSMLSRRYPFFKARDDLEALAQIAAITGTKKIRKFAESIEKDFICHPPIQAVDSYRTLCVKLACRECPQHKPSEASPVAKGKRKRVQSPQTNAKRAHSEPCTIPTAPLNIGGEEEEECFISKNCTCIPDSAYHLLEGLLEVDPSKRLSADAALKHEFLQSE